jgi:putative acetyltransferase
VAAVYAFVSDLANLPRWAPGLGSDVVHEDGRWSVGTPDGRARVEMAPPNPFGVLDHDVTTPSGELVHVPLRALADGDGSEVVFTLRPQPGMSDEDLDRDEGLVTSDLARLKRVLETPTIAVDDPQRADVLGLLGEHLADMYATSPAESVHALDPTELAAPGITFWTARDETGAILGCAALKRLDPADAELKSMRTATGARGRGIGTALLRHVIAHATDHGYRTVHLETGTQDYFATARRLYEGAGFVECPPFGDYRLDPHSVFYRFDLAETPGR